MKRRDFLVAAAAVAFTGPARAADPVRRVLAGTSHIEDIVSDLMGGEVLIETFAPGGSCPMHTDLKVSSVVFAAKAQIAIFHEGQQRMAMLQNLLKSAKNERLRTEYVRVEGNWMVPEVQAQASRLIAPLLENTFPEIARRIRERLERRLASVAQARKEASGFLAAAPRLRVAADHRQADFLRWAGVTVVEAYDSSAELSPRHVADLAKKLRGQKLDAVVDNFQSSSELGPALARELRLPRVVLSNFPMTGTAEGDYLSLFASHVRKLSALLKQ